MNVIERMSHPGGDARPSPWLRGPQPRVVRQHPVRSPRRGGPYVGHGFHSQRRENDGSHHHGESGKCYFVVIFITFHFDSWRINHCKWILSASWRYVMPRYLVFWIWIASILWGKIVLKCHSSQICWLFIAIIFVHAKELPALIFIQQGLSLFITNKLRVVTNL